MLRSRCCSYGPVSLSCFHRFVARLDPGVCRLSQRSDDAMLYRQSNARIAAFVVLLAASLAQFGCATSFSSQKDQTLTSPEDPTLILRIDRSFHPLPPLKFQIESLTNVDRRVFVDSDGKGAIRRLVIVQFETVRPGAGFRFVYPPRPPAEFGAQTYRFGAYVHDDETEAAKLPAREAGLTRNFLLKDGFKVPSAFRVARLARVTDQKGMSEVIIFYMEAADVDFPIRPFPGADEDGDLTLDEAEAQSLLARMKSVVTPMSG